MVRKRRAEPKYILNQIFQTTSCNKLENAMLIVSNLSGDFWKLRETENSLISHNSC